MDLGKSSGTGRQTWAMTPNRKYKGSVAQFVTLCLQIPEGRKRISGEVMKLENLISIKSRLRKMKD